jgi:hypothetical protein
MMFRMFHHELGIGSLLPTAGVAKIQQYEK